MFFHALTLAVSRGSCLNTKTFNGDRDELGVSCKSITFTGCELGVSCNSLLLSVEMSSVCHVIAYHFRWRSSGCVVE